jgi:phage recombination protein Bet
VTTELKTTTPRQEMALPNVSNESLQVLKKTVCADHSDDQVKLFLMYCQTKGLDPFAREVFSIIRKGKQTFQTGIDGLRSMAEDTGQYDGCELYWCAKDGKWVDVWLEDVSPYAAKAVVSRRDCAKPFVAVAKWSEYKPDEDWMWRKMPSNQLAKCAEALALRKAFPRKLGGLYASEEMDQANNRAPSRAAVPDEAIPMPKEKPVDTEAVPAEPASQDQGISDSERKMLFKLAREAWGEKYEENLRKFIKAKYNTEHTSKLTPEQFADALAEMKEAAVAAKANADTNP